MKTTLQKWGNSHGVRIPKKLVEILGVGVGSEVQIELSEDETSITITPSRESRPVRGRHRIEDLIAASSPESFTGEYDWGVPQGKEVW